MILIFLDILCIARGFYIRMHYNYNHKNKEAVFWKEAHTHSTKENTISRNVEPIYLIRKLRKINKTSLLRGLVSCPVFCLFPIAPLFL